MQIAVDPTTEERRSCVIAGVILSIAAVAYVGLMAAAMFTDVGAVTSAVAQLVFATIAILGVIFMLAVAPRPASCGRQWALAAVGCFSIWVAFFVPGAPMVFAAVYLIDGANARHKLRRAALRELAVRGDFGYLTRDPPPGRCHGEGPAGGTAPQWIDLSPSINDEQPLYLVWCHGAESVADTAILKQSGAARYDGTSNAWREALCLLLKWSPTAPELSPERLVRRARARRLLLAHADDAALHDDDAALLREPAVALLPRASATPLCAVRLTALKGDWQVTLIEADCDMCELRRFADAVRRPVPSAQLNLTVTAL